MTPRFADGWLSERDLRAGARIRLFCLPHAGSGAAVFYRWKRELAGRIDVVPVLLPGREARLLEPAVDDPVRLVEHLMVAIRPYLDVPFAVFGHSMGALLAYELALRAEMDGRTGPDCLFVSGREAAHLPFGHRDLHRLGDEAFVAELRRRYGGMPEDFLADPELREVFLPIVRADLKLVESYRHGPEGMLRCPVVALAGADDPSVSEAGLAGWGELTTGAFTAGRLRGDHFYHMGAGQAELLELIAERLG